jgi:hypothetical protein
MNAKVYLETTIISYLAARPTKDVVVAAHQQLTHKWWTTRRHSFALFVSDIVRDEANRGDRDAASRRSRFLAGIEVLDTTNGAQALTIELLRSGALPEKAGADAAHIALAAVNDMDYLLTWNCTHINNAIMKPRIQSICAKLDLRCPEICTPEELMEEP